MRIDRVTWTSLGVVAALVAVAVAVAAVRAAGRPSPPPRAAVAAPAAAPLLARGAAAWDAECAACHALAEVAPAAARLAASPGGRAALVDFLLDGRPRRPGAPPGPADHPAFAGLPDRDLAAALDHLLAAGGADASVEPAEIAARRAALR